jgi:GT2 family glycosyltransferase
VVVIVVTHNSERDVAHLLDDVSRDAETVGIRVVVVDNDSVDSTAEVVRRHRARAILVTNPRSNRGFAAGINGASAYLDGAAHALILNPDLRLAPGAVSALVEAAQQADVGAVVPLVLDATGGIRASLRREPSLGRALGDALLGARASGRPSWASEVEPVGAMYKSQHDVDWATGAALLVRVDVARAVGPWDEDFFLYSEEVDYCRRIREAGWKVRFTPHAMVVHREGGSGSSPLLDALQIVNRVRYVRKWHKWPYSSIFWAITAVGTLLRLHQPGRAAAMRALVTPGGGQALTRAILSDSPR